MVRLLVCALIVGTLTSVLLGVMGFQAMPGELASRWQLEWFHGIGIPAYAVAGCAILIAWVLAVHISGSGIWMELGVLALLVIPAMSFLRAYLIGIVASIIVAAFFVSELAPEERRWPERDSGYKRLLRLVVVTLSIGTVIFFLKTSTREEGNELSGREIVWPIEIASVMRHPVFGLGPYGDIELLRFQEDLPQVGAAHSDYLAAAVCYGVPGLLLFVGALYSLWTRILRYPAVGIEARSCRYAALFSLAGLSTTIIAENVIRDPRLFALHLLFPALCLSAIATRPKGCEMTAARRIIANTLATYLKFFVFALTGLFAVPVALRTLGAVDYGIFSVIGGCLALLMFLNYSFPNGAQRHIAYALGEGGREGATKWFTTSLIVHLVMGAALAGSALIASDWILHHLLTLPTSRLAAAAWVYRMVSNDGMQCPGNALPGVAYCPRIDRLDVADEHRQRCASHGRRFLPQIPSW